MSIEQQKRKTKAMSLVKKVNSFENLGRISELKKIKDQLSHLEEHKIQVIADIEDAQSRLGFKTDQSVSEFVYFQKLNFLEGMENSRARIQEAIENAKIETSRLMREMELSICQNDILDQRIDQVKKLISELQEKKLLLDMS